MKYSKSFRIISILVLIAYFASFIPVRAVNAQAARPAPPRLAELAQAVDHPLSLSRVQSSYTGGLTTLTFTLTNNLPSIRLPEISETATTTDTVNTLAVFDITDDVNTLRGVTLADTLANGVTFLAASGSPAQAGSTLTWTLPDLPPQANATVTLTVQTPAQGSGFVSLDAGAQVNAEQWGNPINAAAAPALLIPIGIDPAYTLPTVDADAHDVDMLWKSAEFSQQPLALFEYVRGLGFDPYKGSLRGTRGTLWGQAGNSADLSSLLIAMLRAAGIPARYRHGTLSAANAQTLLASMFPQAQGMAGYLPDGVELADPVNDAALVTLTQDHWWVEAYLPGSGWMNLDPSFDSAQVGDVFATPGANDRIAELPDAIRHKVNVALLVEQYSQFPIGGTNLNQFTPLEITYNTVQLAAKSLSVGHIVETDVEGGAVYLNVTHRYSPFFAVGGDNFLLLGDPFQDFLSNFPLASNFTTAEWLTLTITDPDGHNETFTRTLKDLIGLDVRLRGGNANVALPTDNSAFLTPTDVYVATLLPNAVRDAGLYDRQRGGALADSILMAQATQTIRDQGDPPTPEEQAAAQTAALDFQLAYARFLSLLGYDFAQAADRDLAAIEDMLRVKLFYATPRVILNASEPDDADGTVLQTLDLRSTRAESIVYPGQALNARHTAQWTKGVLESYREGQALQDATGLVPVTTARIFEAMTEQGIQPIKVTPETMGLLDLYGLDPAATAHAFEALLEGKTIVIPSAPVALDGEFVLGWWEVDLLTGETISVMENGLHVTAIEYQILEIWDKILLFYQPGKLAYQVDQMYDWIACNVQSAVQGGGDCGDPPYPPNPAPGPPEPLPNPIPTMPPLPALRVPSSSAQPSFADNLDVFDPSWLYLPAHICPIDNCGGEQFISYDLAPGAQPLPDLLFGHARPFYANPLAIQSLSVSDNNTGGAPSLQLSTSIAETRLLPTGSLTFDVLLEANFTDDVIVSVLVPDGWYVRFDDADTVAVFASPDAALGSYTLELVAQAQGQPEVFATAEQTVDVLALQALSLSVTADPRTTIPKGVGAFPAASIQTNDGEAETPDSAYIVGLSNRMDTAKTIELTISGAPTDWIVLNGMRQSSATLTLDAFGQALVGLYVLPLTPPAPGTSLNLTVTASDGGSLSVSKPFTWVMPAQPFNFVTVEPATLYLAPNSSTDFAMQISNVGNAAGAFPVSASLPPITASVSGLPASVTLAVGEAQSFNATFYAGDVPPGARFPLVIGSLAPDSYTQYAVANVQIVSEISGVVFQAADNAATVCTLGEPGLSASLENLALAMTTLETACQNGECHPIPRDQVVSAAYGVALYAGAVHNDLDGLDALIAAADSLATHTDPADVITDLQAISAAVSTLDGEVCAWSQHSPELRWTPSYGAALQNQTTPYTLTLTNRGSLETTYALTVTLPGSVISEQVTVASGETQTYVYPLAMANIGQYDLSASVTVVGRNSISAYSQAKLNVVDKFIQLTAVRPTPDFVETGTSSTTLFVDVANIANIPWQATAHAEITAPDGSGLAHASDTSVTILVGAPRSYELQTVDTSGWAAGVYTVTVELLDGNGNLIPDGSGYGYLGVGQLLGVSHSTAPLIVAPGTVTVTTAITTEILVPGIVPQNLQINKPANWQTSQSAVSSPQSAMPLPPLAPASTFAITRTQNTAAAFTYTGTWTTINNIFASHLSDGSYTASSTPGATAAFAFNGPWVHIGFSKARNGGIAEIFVDGISRGTVDLYNPVQQCFNSECASSAAFNGLGEGPHLLEIIVTGTAHPNANGVEIKLDYVDTWDGTLYPDGLYEQDDPRIMVQPGAWFNINQAEASGGSFMYDGAIGNSQSAWFPFTGDSASFVALARGDSYRVHVWVDGAWQGNVLIYAGQAITRTYSFSGFGPGPHVMQIGTFRGEANVDAFITPAVGPDYDPPIFTGLVRYEEDHPALRYNGYDFTHRPNTWSIANAGQTSDYAFVQSSAAGDTVSFDFYGSWLEIGLRTRNRGGLAEVNIDGISYGNINAYTPNEDIIPFQFDLITGTHTATITILGISDPPNAYNQVYLDYVEFWDASPVSDDFQNARLGEESGRVHVSNSADDVADPNAIQGDFVDSGLPNSLANVWYSFVGSSVTFYGFTRQNTSNVEVYIDGILTDTVSLNYPFSTQPLAFHYTGLDYGPHSIRIRNLWELRVDGFASNQPALPYQPIAEWWDDTPAGNGAPFFGTVGIGAGMAAGDVDGDGLPEIVVTSDDVINFGSLYVYRGDGADTGDGDPIKWTHSFGGGVFRTWVGTPALADLDGLPGSEIVVAAGNDLYAFYGDGSTYWVTDTVNIFETLSAPAIGNLDLDPEPEIVVNLGNRLEVRSHDGGLLWSTVYPEEVNPPVLADLTGDGLLDIVLTGWDDDVLVYDFNYGSPQLIWSAVLGSSMAGTFGAPAVADIDGQQPGGDPGPEIAFASNGLLTVLDGPDGSLIWSAPLEAGNPGGISIADLDGDGEIEIVTGMRHEFETGRFGKLYALNADGSLLWQAIAEDSTSANNASVLDLDGDGIYEVAWNGREQGFTIFNGLDGSVIFNEPMVYSLTGTDYPLIADVDGDGQAEVVVAALRGVRVFGNGAAWTDARPLWNQHSYHITNINDDLSIPFSEPNSWEVHNTYRTQTPQRYPMLAFSVSLTHTVGLEHLTVITETFNVPPSTLNLPTFNWDYTQTWETPIITRTFNLQLSNLQPGSSRLVAQSTSVDYTLPSGSNHLELPPLYVSVPHIIAIEPALQTAPNGATVTFLVTLSNPGPSGALYTPTVTPLPGVTWGPLNPVNVPAGGEVALSLTADIAVNAEPASLPFGVFVSTSTGGSDQAGGVLTLSGPALTVEISPASTTVPTGSSADFTLTVTNLESTARTYDLSAVGLAALDLPSQVSVPANSTVQITFSAQAVGEGGNPFTVIATESGTGASAEDTAVVIGEGSYLVEVTLNPAAIPSGPGVLTSVDVIVANLGSLPDIYDLNAALPVDWDGRLTLFGQPISAIQVPPGVENAVTLQLLLSPATNAAPGDYAISVTAQSALAADSGAGVVQVGSLGVSVAIISGPTEIDDSGTWQVLVTNHGAADTYNLAAFGPFAPFAQITPASVSLSAGGSQTVELRVTDVGFLLASDYPLGIHAQSQTQAAIQDEDSTMVTISAQPGLVVAWLPPEQTIDTPAPAAFTLVISNTGNAPADYQLTISASGSADVQYSVTTLFLPAGSTARLLVIVNPPGVGIYTITAAVVSDAVQASDTATLQVGAVVPRMYLPLMYKAP